LNRPSSPADETDDSPDGIVRRGAVVIKILLKKSLVVSVVRFSGVFLPLTRVRERFVGRSERSIFEQES
jgi:hypothetical protein